MVFLSKSRVFEDFYFLHNCILCIENVDDLPRLKYDYLHFNLIVNLTQANFIISTNVLNTALLRHFDQIESTNDAWQTFLAKLLTNTVLTSLQRSVFIPKYSIN